MIITKPLELLSKSWFLIIIVVVLLLLNGCAARKSIISVNQIQDENLEKIKINISEINIDTSSINKSKKTRFVDQTQALIYDFTFLVHENVDNTLPRFISKSVFLSESKDFSSTRKLDLKVNIDTDLFIYTGLSAAPRYELTIGLPSEIILNQEQCAAINVSKRDEVVIGAFSNTQSKRDEVMTSRYRTMLSELYKEYLESLVRAVEECD